MVMEECKTVQTAWRPRPAQLRPTINTLLYFPPISCRHIENPRSDISAPWGFQAKLFQQVIFLSLHANIHPFCHFQNGNHLNLFTIINRPSPQTNLLDTQQGRLCARWCVCVYCLHRPGDSAAAGQSAAAAVDIIVLTFVTLRLGMLSWQTPGLSSAEHQPSVTGDPAHLKTSNTSASCATSWPGSDPSTLIKLQSEIFGCHKRKIDYLCLN